MPVTGGCLTIAIGWRQWLAADCADRQNAGSKEVTLRAVCHVGDREAWRAACWSRTAVRPLLCIAKGPSALHAGLWPQTFARRHRSSSGRGTGPKRNTVPRELPHQQRAGVETKVAVLYAESSSTLDWFRNSRRDREVASASAPLCDGLAILPVAMKVREEILMDLPRRFLDANQGSGQASRCAFCSAADNTTVRLYCQSAVHTTNKER